jgi:hypothetical protein
MVHQLLRVKKRADNSKYSVLESDADDNLYVNVAASTPIDIASGTIDTVTEVEKAVLYGTDKDGLQWPILINDEGQLDTLRMQDSSVLVNSYVTFPAAAAQYTTLFGDITNPDNETYDLYNLYITNPLPSVLKLSIRNKVTNSAGIDVNHEIYTTNIPASPAVSMTDTAWSSCFTDIGGVLTDDSADMNDNIPGGTPDVPFAFTATNDAIYFGHTANFRNVTLSVGTAGVYDAAFIWEYWNGSAWTELTGTVTTTGTVAAPFKSVGLVIYRWNTPDDWVAYDIPGNPISRYWVRCRCTSFTSRTITPNFIQGWVLQSRDVISHMYQIESMFNGGDARVVVSNDTALTTIATVPIYYTIKKY